MLGQALWHANLHTYRENNCQVAFDLDNFCLSYAIFSKGVFFSGTPFIILGLRRKGIDNDVNDVI